MVRVRVAVVVVICGVLVVREVRPCTWCITARKNPAAVRLSISSSIPVPDTQNRRRRRTVILVVTYAPLPHSGLLAPCSVAWSRIIPVRFDFYNKFESIVIIYVVLPSISYSSKASALRTIRYFHVEYTEITIR